MLRKGLAVVLLGLALTGCNVVDAVKEGMQHSDEAAVGIEQQIGIKPGVAFNFNNGEFTSVTVQFASVPDKPLAEIERVSRAEVEKAFKQAPKHLVLSFVYSS